MPAIFVAGVPPSAVCRVALEVLSRLGVSQLFEFFGCQMSLLENLPRGSFRNVTRVHCDIRLSSVDMAQDLVRTLLTVLFESCEKQLGENLTS